MFRSPSLSVDYYAPSTGSSASSSQSSTGKHSPPPLWSATDKLILRIKAFLDNGFYDCDSNDLVLPVQPVEFTAFRRELRRPRFLDPTQVPNILYTWNRQTSILTIPCMAGPVHDSLIRYLVHYKEDMQSIHPLTRSERRSIDFYTGTSTPLLANPSSSTITGHGKHVMGVYKEPDAAFEYVDRRPNATATTMTTGICPRIVFEVAFSQTYESVLEDARQWLVRSDGWVKLCIIIKIYEQPHHRTDAQATSEIVDQQHVDGAASADGASASNSGTTVSTPDDRMASMDGRNHFLKSTDEHSRWVSPLTGFMELYRLSNDESSIVQDGPRYDLFDPSGPDPEILISDLLPADAIEGPVDRAYPFVLADYRMFINEGVQKLALLRKLKMESRQRKQETQDPDYGTGGEGAGSPGSSEQSTEGGEGYARSRAA